MRKVRPVKEKRSALGAYSRGVEVCRVAISYN